ncbi:MULTISPECIES: DUF1217 domain-containing protein [unclassified Yoonia]|uniref:DUF1217 domain-containing protein n=1 Tax=unclassified Yoonia TaxID=2629118 RepID=UPI002B002EE1|nr:MULTISPECIES: DUF1217 domain-containing protein [unclassified Yoonia]
MSFQPILPMTGYVGWRFLERTLETQRASFAKSPPVQRATDYFRENIGNIRSAEDLVKDRRLLSVALGAFGLDDDINNTFFIRKILEDGTESDTALANRLSDNRYAELSRAFGFGDLAVPRSVLPSFATETIARYEKRQFEKAVGTQNNDLRLALNLRESLAEIIDSSSNDGAHWFSVMGNAPLRKVFETALGLPSSIGSIDIDRQRDIFRSRAKALIGTNKVADLADPAQQEKLIRLFLIRAETAQSNNFSTAAAALSLLQSAPRIGRLT